MRWLEATACHLGFDVRGLGSASLWPWLAPRLCIAGQAGSMVGRYGLPDLGQPSQPTVGGSHSIRLRRFS